MNKLIVALLEDDCSGLKCPEMRSSDWQYLCAGRQNGGNGCKIVDDALVHTDPNECTCIDYCLHTLDSATITLNSQKYFPSR